MTAQEQIITMTKFPYKYSLNVEYDREVITVRLYDLWLNKTVITESDVNSDLAKVVLKVYRKFKQL